MWSFSDSPPALANMALWGGGPEGLQMLRWPLCALGCSTAARRDRGCLVLCICVVRSPPCCRSSAGKSSTWDACPDSLCHLLRCPVPGEEHFLHCCRPKGSSALTSPRLAPHRLARVALEGAALSLSPGPLQGPAGLCRSPPRKRVSSAAVTCSEDTNCLVSARSVLYLMSGKPRTWAFSQ